MKQTVNKSQFRDAFLLSDRKHNFTYDALGILFDYLEENNEDYYLNVVTLCVEYSEQSPAQIAADYRLDEDNNNNNAMEYLQHNTQIVGVTNAGDIIYANF
jgi:hypothetical protein